MLGAAQAAVAVYSFRCTACGKCCNSGPQLSLPELFHHQHRFIGSLTLRRVRRLHGGDALPHGAASADDVQAHAALAERLLHPLPGGAFDLLLATQAHYDPRAARCPMLLEGGGCAVHDDHKPGACSVAPLEAWLPDRRQSDVLRGHLQTAAYVGADCIRAGDHGDPLVRRLRVLQPSAVQALRARREALALDKLHWGDAVFWALSPTLLSTPQALARIPTEGFAAVALTPVLAVLAGVSARCRARTVEFLHAQLPQLQRAESIEARERHALSTSAQRLLQLFAEPRPLPVHPQAAQIEAWLGL